MAAVLTFGLILLVSSSVIADDSFNPRADAETLHKTVETFFKSDTDTIIKIFSNRTHEQRIEINSEYKKLYGKYFDEVYNIRIYGSFQQLLRALRTPLPEYQAKSLYDSMIINSYENSDGTVTTDYEIEGPLFLIMCTTSNQDMKNIKQAYKSTYGSSLEDDLNRHTAGDFEKLLISLASANRDETLTVNKSAAEIEANRLYEAGEKNWGTEELIFITDLVNTNTAQLNEIFTAYRNISGHSIESAIEDEFSGDLEQSLVTIVKWAKNKSSLLASKFHTTMDRLGTDDRELIRLVVTTPKSELKEIKHKFEQKYDKSLEEMISDDTSGSYRTLLLALIK